MAEWTEDDVADLDLVVELIRRALDRLDELSAEDYRTQAEHGRPVVAMMDESQPLDVRELRRHLIAVSGDVDLVNTILGRDEASAREAIRRARALRLARVWGLGHPSGDD